MYKKIIFVGNMNGRVHDLIRMLRNRDYQDTKSLTQICRNDSTLASQVKDLLYSKDEYLRESAAILLQDSVYQGLVRRLTAEWGVQIEGDRVIHWKTKEIEEKQEAGYKLVGDRFVSFKVSTDPICGLQLQLMNNLMKKHGISTKREFYKRFNEIIEKEKKEHAILSAKTIDFTKKKKP
ncbi:hypothetical protein ACFL5G_03000 [Candidatus Margulisiibacteriota bacterium]